jgi:ankyrin repeat protein
MLYRFCLSSDCETIHELELHEGDDLTWDRVVSILQEKIKMSKVNYLELCDETMTRIGERIRDIDDLEYGLKCYGDNMVFKVYGKLVVSSGIVVTKKSTKSPRVQDSLDSLLSPSTPSTYDPLVDFQKSSIRKSTSASNPLPPRDVAETPPSPRDPITIVKKQRQRLSNLSSMSSESTSSEVYFEKTLSPCPPLESPPHLEQSPTIEQTLVEEEPLSFPEEVEEVPCSLAPQNEQEEVDVIAHELVSGAVEAEGETETEVVSQATQSLELPLEELKIPRVSQREIEEPSHESPSPPPQEESQDTLPPVEVIKSNTEEITFGTVASDLTHDFSSSLQSILAGLSRLESTISSSSPPEVTPVVENPWNPKHLLTPSLKFDPLDPSRPNMASLKTSAEIEAERFEQEALEAKVKQDEEARQLRELMERERKAMLDKREKDKPKLRQEGNSQSISSSHEPTSPPLSDATSQSNLKEELVSIQFNLFDKTKNHLLSLSLPNHCEWEALTMTIAQNFKISSRSISHFVLLDEDDDEISGKLNEHLKFWKIYEKYSTLSGRYFSVHYDQQISKMIESKPSLQPPNPTPPLVVESEKLIEETNPISLYKRTTQPLPEVIVTPAEVMTMIPVSVSKPERHGVVEEKIKVLSKDDPPSLVEEVYDFRLSTDYIDEKTPVSILKNDSWESITSLVLNTLSNITPAQKLTSTVSKLSLFDDDGDEIVGSIDNGDHFWKVVSSRYKKNSTIFVAHLMTSLTSIPLSSTVAPLPTITPTPTLIISKTQKSKNLYPDPSLHSLPIFCRLFDGIKKESVLIPINSNWELLTAAICSHWKLSKKEILTISLFDSDDDELFGGINDEKKFWKCYKTHYDKQYTEFVFTMTDTKTTMTTTLSPTSHLSSRSTKNQSGGTDSPRILLSKLQFQLAQHNEILLIEIPQNTDWASLASLLFDHFQLNPEEHQLMSIDLVDSEGDHYGTFTKEHKFWKSVQTYNKGSRMRYVFTVDNKEIQLIPKSKTKKLPPPLPLQTVVPLNFRLESDDPNMDTVAIPLPENATWSELTEAMNEHFDLGTPPGEIKMFKLIDQDGDLLAEIKTEKKFWKVVKTSYHNDLTFVLHLNSPLPPLAHPPPATATTTDVTSRRVLSTKNITNKSPVARPESPSLPPEQGQEFESTGRPLFFCSSFENFAKKTIISLPENASWKEIEQTLQMNFNLKAIELLNLKLIDDDGDEYCDVITDATKFWKVVESRYAPSGDLSFLFTVTKSTKPESKSKRVDESPTPVSVSSTPTTTSLTTKSKIPSSPLAAAPAAAVIPCRPLQFRLHDEDVTASTVISIKEKATWEEITNAILGHYNLPSTTSVTHLDLIDEEGDEITSGLCDEKKFWKFIKKFDMSGDPLLILVWYEIPAVESESSEEEEEVDDDMVIPLYFRLCHDAVTDKGVVDIPVDEPWERILELLIEFFDIDTSAEVINSLKLVDDDNTNTTELVVTSHLQFWDIIRTQRYDAESMVFVIQLSPLRQLFHYLFQLSSINYEIGIYEKSDWTEICSKIMTSCQGIPLLSSSESTKIASLSLIDEDGDEVFSKITDERKFWKAALSKYKVNETIFLIVPTEKRGGLVRSSSSTSSLGTGISALDSSSSTPTSVNNTTTSQPTMVIKKKTKIQTPTPSTSTLAPPKPPPAPAPASSTPIPLPDPSKFEGRYIELSFKLSSEGLDNEILIPIPAMGSWDQICGAISARYGTSAGTPTIDRLELLDDEEATLLTNIVSSSKFWKACLEQYHENETIFNICLHEEQERVSKIQATTPASSTSQTNSGNNTVNGGRNGHGGGRAGGGGGNKKMKSETVTIESFFTACSDNNSEYVREVLSKQLLDITSTDERGLSAVHVAAIGGSLEVMELLLDISHDTNSSFLSLRDLEGMTPFHYACEVNHTTLVRYLFHVAGIMIGGGGTNDLLTLRNKMGLTCLHFIAINGNMDLAPYIPQNLIDIATNSGLTLLHFASDMGHLPMIQFLLSKHAQLHARDDEGLSPLHLACVGNHLDCVEYLITSGAYSNLRDDVGMSPLHHACQEGHLSIVKYLSDDITGGGSNVMARTDSYDSCLHLACRSGPASLPLVKYLVLSKKVDLNARNKDGETPFEVASKLGHEGIANWLEDRGAIMRPETKEEKATRRQIDTKSEKAFRAFEAEELLSLERG